MQAYNIKNARKKILVGDLVIYLILAVSLGVSVAYWYILAGAGNTNAQTPFWTFIIWLVVAVGVVAETIKKVTISYFRNLTIWSVATFVSILTVMGTYSVLDQDKQSELTKQSDSYQMAKGQKAEALKLQAKYAYAQNFNLEELERKKRIAGKKARWGTYNSLKSDIEARKKYLSAVSTLKLSSQNMESGAGGLSSNPFLSSIASFLGISADLLKSIFYLLVTILLEVSAFWIGGQVEQLKQHLELTELEILDLKIVSTFGVSMRDINAELFTNVLRAENDRIEAERQIEEIRKTSRQKLPAEQAAEQVKRLRNESKEKQKEAIQPHPTPNLPPQNSLNEITENTPSLGFGFLSNIAPKQVQSAPKKVQGAERGAPKKGRLETAPNVDIVGKGAGGKRKKETADTGTSGKNANRYKALKKAIEAGKVRPSYRGIKAFKYGGRGMGASTVKIYMEALKKEGII